MASSAGHFPSEHGPVSECAGKDESLVEPEVSQ